MEKTELIGYVSNNLPCNCPQDIRPLAGQTVRLEPLLDSIFKNQILVISIADKNLFGKFPISYITADEETWTIFESKVNALQKQEKNLDSN